MNPIPGPAVRARLYNQFDAGMADPLAQVALLRQMHPEYLDAVAYQNLMQQTRAAMAPLKADRFLHEAPALRGNQEAKVPPHLDPKQLPPMAEAPKRLPPPHPLRFSAITYR